MMDENRHRKTRAYFLARNNGLTSISEGSTVYYHPTGVHDNSATESDRQTRIFEVTRVEAITVWVTSNSTDGDTVFTIRKNGSDTNVSVTFSAGETGAKAGQGAALFQKNDLISIEASVGSSGLDTITPATFTTLYRMR